MHPARAAAIIVSFGVVLMVNGPQEMKTVVPGTPAPGFASRPLAFELNAGQSDARVRFLARGCGGTAFITDTGMVLAAPAGALTIRPVTSSSAVAEGVDELAGKANYFLGNEPANWRTNLPTYSCVRQSGVWPGIDLVWHGSDAGRLEYDFIVAPGADPSVICVEFAGADDVTIDARGALVATVGEAEFRQPVPVVYEELDGARRTIEGRYLMDGGNRVRFEILGRDSSRTLCIDPVVQATYLGGGGTDLGYRIFRDGAGATWLQAGIAMLLTWLTVAVGVIRLDVSKWIPSLGGVVKVAIFLGLGGLGLAWL